MTLMIIAWLSFVYMIAWYLNGALFEPRYIWVGVYWCIKTEWNASYSATNFDSETPSYYGIDYMWIYICCVPMFPIKLEFKWM